MDSWLKNLAGALIPSLLASAITVYASSQVNNVMIAQLAVSTEKLSEAVTELKVIVSAQDERFVTKDMLHSRFREFREELKNGP